MCHSKRLSILLSLCRKKIFEQDKPKTSRKTKQRLLNFAVGHVHLNCNDIWYTQKDGFAMLAYLAVLLANLWMKEIEPVVRIETFRICKPMKDLNDICPDCRKKNYV